MWERVKCFFNSLKNRFSPKRFIRIALIILAILIPTILAIISLSRYNSVSLKQSERVHTAILFDKDGNELYRENAESNEGGDTSLISIFNTINDNLTPTSKISDSVVTEEKLVATLISPAKTITLDCYFSFTEGSSYCVDESGSYFKIDKEDSERFLASSFAEPLYKDARCPVLTTADGHSVTPHSVSWYYQNVEGGFAEALKNPTVSEVLAYDITGGISLSFNIQPDECHVNVFSGENLIFDGSLSDLSRLKFDSSAPLLVNAVAEWKQNSGSQYYGRIDYNFYVTVQKRAEFSINKTSLSAGEFAILSATHVSDISKIYLSCSDPSFDPIFFSNGTTVHAIIPCPSVLSENGTLDVTVSYGISMQKFTIEVTEEACFAQAIINQAARSRGIMDIGFSTSAEYIFLNKNVTDPCERGYDVTTEFGSPSESTYSYFTQYSHASEYGVLVPSISAGKVVSKGYSSSLGNYVIIDAGLGMRFCYINLSWTDVSVGEYVATGDPVGRTSNTFGTSHDGFAVILTCGNSVLNCEYLLKQ